MALVRVVLNVVLVVLLNVVFSHAWVKYSLNGTATMTHYTIPLDYVAACGCNPSSTHYPTAALSQFAYGSSRAYGPGCGRCFNLTLITPYQSDPPFYPNPTKSIVLKVTDLCPISGDGWCSATDKKLNPAGESMNFDLAWPSPAIPDDFFPSNQTLYGFTDFGVWHVTYESVSCELWAGFNDTSALGSVSNLGPESVCCPGDPLAGDGNATCSSYSDNNGIPPDAKPPSGGADTVHLDPVVLIGYLIVGSMLTMGIT